MKRSRRRRSGAVWGAAFLAYLVLGAALPAQAYLDPGSGSMLFQILIGGLVAGAVAVKAFWARIVGLFRRGPEDEAEKASRQPAESID